MKEHTGALHANALHTHIHIPHKKLELWNNNLQATSSSKILAGHRHTRLHHGHGGIVYPTEPRSLLTFCHQISIHPPLHTLYTDPAATKTSGSTLRHLPFPPFKCLSPLNICRCIFTPVLPNLSSLFASNGIYPPLSLTLFTARDNEPRFPRRFIPRLSRPRDLTNRVRGRGKGYNSTESSKRNGTKIFAPRIRRTPRSSLASPLRSWKRPWNNTRGPIHGASDDRGKEAGEVRGR